MVLRNSHRRIARSVVDNHDLKVGKRLRSNAAKRFVYPLLGIKCRDYYRYQIILAIDGSLIQVLGVQLMLGYWPKRFSP